MLNERRRINSFTSGIWKPTLRSVCQTFLRSDVLALKQLISFISYILMPVLEEGKLLYKERLANEKSIDSTDDGKSDGFREILR